ncbi:MAG: hypothetical protein OEW35_10235 [Gammaproteobacteria bacterium]|nr:hypothetical protein [Gammaproteobacteria bacterium]MDH4255577.1 hypothetical protein [Gammaproteobacteria bacterium]MDH5311568.1 hypothetical protein [Gammaproteobacteria bacterium]
MFSRCDAEIAGRDGRDVPEPANGRQARLRKLSLRKALAALARPASRLHGYRSLSTRALERALDQQDGC